MRGVFQLYIKAHDHIQDGNVVSQRVCLDELVVSSVFGDLLIRNPKICKSNRFTVGILALCSARNMFGNEKLLEQLEQSSATFVNLSLVPRVSRAQKLDALTSMANIGSVCLGVVWNIRLMHESGMIDFLG